MKKSHQNHVIKHQKFNLKKKTNVRWKGTVKLLMYFANVTWQDHYRKKCILDLQREREWKNCFYHILSFKQKIYSNKTTISNYTWHLKKVSNETPNLKWSVLKWIPPYLNTSCAHA